MQVRFSLKSHDRDNVWDCVYAENGIPGSASQLIVGTDAKAVSLADGSIVRIRESSELWVQLASVGRSTSKMTGSARVT